MREFLKASYHWWCINKILVIIVGFIILTDGLVIFNQWQDNKNQQEKREILSHILQNQEAIKANLNELKDIKTLLHSHDEDMKKMEGGK